MDNPEAPRCGLYMDPNIVCPRECPLYPESERAWNLRARIIMKVTGRVKLPNEIIESDNNPNYRKLREADRLHECVVYSQRHSRQAGL